MIGSQGNVSDLALPAMRKAASTLALDVAIILAMSMCAGAAHFSVKQGRALISGDSVQHLDSAEALVNGDRMPDFSFRKPGYTLIIAALGWLTDNMSWSVVVWNHLMLALLPLAAYGLGRRLCSRSAGWLAAILTIAQIQVSLWGWRIMSEATYTCLLSFGLLCLSAGLAGRRTFAWMTAAGALLGWAWLVRAVGIAVIAAAAVVVLWIGRRQRLRTMGAIACLLCPLAITVVFECSLNRLISGRFRTTTGSLGVMLATRPRYFQGSPLPSTPTAETLLDLLPERSADDAFLANHLDVCVARCRAIRDHGLDDWTFQRLGTRFAWEMIAAEPQAYLQAAAAIWVRHVLRQSEGPPASPVPAGRRKPIIVHPAAPDFAESQHHWYAYWYLPHRTVEESVGLVRRMEYAAAQRAPFGRGGLWDLLRYLGSTPVVVDAMNVLRSVASVWPGLALIFCGWLGVNRGVRGLLAAVYVADACLIAACGSTDTDNVRYQCVWLAADTALTACLVTSLVENTRRFARRRWAANRHEPAFGEPQPV